ncbi:MAG: glycine cleavage system protein H [Actinomycetota bacterium]|nr:MAG: glycine cleavage system H protein [Acidimicrobiaceae bacterium]
MSDQVWRGCSVPDDLLYDVDHHVWVRFDGDEAIVGMTDVSQTMCGRFVSVSWKRPGRPIIRGRPIAVVESAKWVGPFPAPLSGTLLANNEAAFADDIAVANRDPYGEGWIARLAPSRLDEELGLLVDGAEAFARYQTFIDENDIRCFRCAQ